MKASPYLVFNGNCIEAIALYEKAFGTKATYCQYKDAPSSEHFPITPETAEFVMHGVLPIGKESIYLCDTTPDQPSAFGNGSFACVEFDNAEAVKAAFEILKDGGKVFCEAQETFWNNCYAELEDKFGLKWTLMIECTCTEECATGNNPNCTCQGCRCKENASEGKPSC
ncbi:MAG: VOC family protein [Oscillospiraceae bacterium]|nr:VOC family protein [Oscillospiraceae bacterium]